MYFFFFKLSLNCLRKRQKKKKIKRPLNNNQSRRSKFLLFFFVSIFFCIIMDDIQHPLVLSPTSPMRGPVDSPAPNAADEMATNLTAHRDSMSEATNKFEQQPSTAFRGRSKSLALGAYAWTLNPPRPPLDYFSSNTTAGVPYKARSWEPTLERAIKAIVSIKASHVRSFDTETSGK